MEKILRSIHNWIMRTFASTVPESTIDAACEIPTGNPGTGYTPRPDFNCIIPVSVLKPNDVIIFSMRDSVGMLSNEMMESIKAHTKLRLEGAGINNAILLLNRMDMGIVSPGNEDV